MALRAQPPADPARPRSQVRFSEIAPQARLKNTLPVLRQPRRLTAAKTPDALATPEKTAASGASGNLPPSPIHPASQSEPLRRVERRVSLTESDSISDAFSDAIDDSIGNAVDDAIPPNQAELNEATLSLRAYFKETRHLSDKASLFKNPGKMIAKLYEDLYQDPNYPAPDAANAWTALDCPHADQLQQLLLHVIDEEAPPASRMPMLRGLLQQFLEPQGGKAFAIAGYDFLTSARQMKTVAIVRDEFEAHLLKKFPSLAATPEAAHWLACQLLEKFDPEMLNPKLGHFWYGSAQYSAINADIDIVRSANLYNPDWRLKEISDTAAAVRDTLAAEGAPSDEVLALQSKAALLYAHAKYLPEDKKHLIDLRESATPEDYGIALQALEQLQIARRIRQYAPLQDAIAQLRIAPPMRSQIAEKLLRENNIDDPYAKIGAQLGVDFCAGQLDTPVAFYMNGCIDSLRDRLTYDARDALPDLDQAFEDEFNDWHRKYGEALAVLLKYAVEELPPKEYKFLHENPIHLLQATMKATKLIPYVSPTFRGDPSNTKDITLPGKKSLLLLAKKGQEQRYYLVSPAERDAPMVQRIQPPNGDIGAYIKDHPDIFFDPEILAQTTADALTTSAGVQQLDDCSADKPAECFRKTAAALAALVRTEIHDFGYEPTGQQKTLESIRKFMLGFIPGYDCATADDYAEALEPCLLDAYSIALPLISRFAKLGMALGRVTTEALPLLATRKISEVLARYGAWKAAGTVGAHLQPPLAKIGRDFARGLGKDLLDIGDPGFMLTYEAAGAVRKIGSLAQRIFRDPQVARKLYKQLHRNPHTQHAAHLAKVQRRRAGAELQPQYEGKLSSDANGSFIAFNLPPGAKVQAMPYLKYEEAYQGLDDQLDLYDINGVIYAHNPDPGPGQPLTLIKASTLLNDMARCRIKRGGNAACVAVEMLAPDKNAPSPLGTGYRFNADRNANRIYQFQTYYGTPKKVFLKPTVEAYPVPATIGGIPRRVILMLDDAYELRVTRAKEIQVKMISERYTEFALESPESPWPTEGKIVPGTAAEGLEKIEIKLENGIHTCTVLAPYGSYSGHIGGRRVYLGMIELNSVFIRVEFPDCTYEDINAGNGVVKLSEATEAEINSYRRFQVDSLAAQDRRTSKTFSMELSDTGAGRLLRLYRNYNLAPYQDLLNQIAKLPGNDRLRAAQALDAYIEHPHATGIAEFQDIKSRFDGLLRDQFHNLENLQKFERNLIAAVSRNSDKLDIHWLEPASPRMDETFDTMAQLFPNAADACQKYKQSLQADSHASADERRIRFSDLRKKFWGKNVGWAKMFYVENGMPILEHIYFGVSGKQQANIRNSHMKIRTMKPDEKHTNVDLAILDMQNSAPPAGQAGRAGDDASLTFPDFNDKTGAEQWRGDDAEFKLIRVIREAIQDREGAIDLKMVSMLPPCPLCLQALAEFLEEHPNVKIELTFIRRSRYEQPASNTSPAATGTERNRHSLSRVRRAKISQARDLQYDWPLYLGGTVRRDRPVPPSLRT